MWNWLIGKIVKQINKNNPKICKNCVWHKSEEMYNMPNVKNVRYCALNKEYTAEYDNCNMFVEEKFEAKPDSIQTEEYSLDISISADIKK